ncbi:MAG: hypothetical protein KJ906_02365 [Nanoarchaeota archaeon]|nr:hypothetical protein [Nanoarchaeota archaeon]
MHYSVLAIGLSLFILGANEMLKMLDKSGKYRTFINLFLIGVGIILIWVANVV